MAKPNPIQTDDVSLREDATRLIRELAIKPPVKAMSNVKAATDVFEANRSDAKGADAAEHPPARPIGARQRG